MLEVKNISTGYEKNQVLQNVSLTAEPGEITLLTGGNGSGKSTLLKCIYGLIPIWNKNGEILFQNEEISKYDSSKLVKFGIVYIPQKENYFETLTIQENLMVSGSTYSKYEIKQRQEYVYQLPKLYEFRNRKPFSLSGGEKQLLALGNALMHKPKFILFDEPFTGLDAANTNIMIKQIINLKQQGIGMLIVEHKKVLNSHSNKVIKLKLGKTK